MNQNIEIEFKNLLTKEEFINLMNKLHISEEDFSIQTNHYFDTPLFHLKDKKCALRIREKNNSYTMTLKEPNDIGLLETNLSLTKEEAMLVLTSFNNAPVEIKEKLGSLQIPFEELTFLGSLTTSRYEEQLEEVLLVLDKSSYGNKVDFELEMEVSEEEAGGKFFDNFLKQHNIPKRKTDNKVKRFLQEVLPTIS